MKSSSMNALKVAICLLAASALARADFKGRVIDAATHRAIPAAIVTCGAETSTTAADGSFHISETPVPLGVRAAGYRQTTIAAAAFHNATPDIALQPFHPKALYLSFYGIGSHALRDPVLALASRGSINALVIDMKGDRGLIPYPSSVALAASVGANRIITVKDIRGLVQDLHSRGLYLISRIVVFKDNPLAEARPDLAVKSSANKLWRDREGLAWLDPSKKEAWTYSLDIAVEAAHNGFDEIQFDYVRFPDAKGVAYSVPNTEHNRVAALSGFLTEARARLSPLNVFLAADVFGYIPWNTNDTDIGQRIEKMAPLVDYLCPMLYPSGFQFGIPGFRIPVAHPYEIVRLSLDRAALRSGLAPVHFRPWLQAFRDYAFDKRVFGPAEIAAQIRASQEFGSDGWMLWNPHNVYSGNGL